jgi:hypothetical protein
MGVGFSGGEFDRRRICDNEPQLRGIYWVSCFAVERHFHGVVSGYTCAAK